MTHGTQKVVLGRPDKVFIWEKVVPPARVTLLAEVRQLPPPPPRETSWWSLCKRFLGTFQRNRWKIRLPRVTWGEGGLGYPRSHKWGLKPRQYCLILQPISQLNAQPGFETWFACHHSSLTIKHWRKEVDLLLLCGCIYVRKLVFPL